MLVTAIRSFVGSSKNPRTLSLGSPSATRNVVTESPRPATTRVSPPAPPSQIAPSLVGKNSSSKAGAVVMTCTRPLSRYAISLRLERIQRRPAASGKSPMMNGLLIPGSSIG